MTRRWNIRLGSSPLSRGIPVSSYILSSLVRIIPALAGNTAIRVSRLSTRPDHPRSRGEYTFTINLLKVKFGSSPLSRGIRLLSHNAIYNMGIIPALAGNTSTELLWRDTPGDHPRSRGEYEKRP